GYASQGGVYQLENPVLNDSYAVGGMLNKAKIFVSG
ncbi:unnamed protein product, partial [marine sediment metagenome]